LVTDALSMLGVKRMLMSENLLSLPKNDDCPRPKDACMEEDRFQKVAPCDAEAPAEARGKAKGSACESSQTFIAG
jgi:hypothetical protein